MIPVDQTRYGDPGGNCFSACVASLLELPIDDVPYFMHDWPAAFDAWLEARGLCQVSVPYDPSMGVPPGFYILGGQCPRGSHAVVARGPDIVHDPHPSRVGLTHREDCTVLAPLDPARLAAVGAR